MSIYSVALPHSKWQSTHTHTHSKSKDNYDYCKRDYSRDILFSRDYTERINIFKARFNLSMPNLRIAVVGWIMPRLSEINVCVINWLLTLQRLCFVIMYNLSMIQTVTHCFQLLHVRGGDEECCPLLLRMKEFRKPTELCGRF